MSKRRNSVRRSDLISAGFVVCMALAALHAWGEVREQVDRLAQPYIDADQVVGMTVGILHDGRKYVFGYGRLSADDRRPPDGKTVYEIGSISKVFTGVLLGEAAARGAVHLDDPVQQYLPAESVTMPSFQGQSITLKHLSTHASGLPRMPDNFHPATPSNPYVDYTADRLYTFLTGHQLRRAPGAQYEYSNLAAGLLGHVLARQHKSDYQQLLVARLCEPLQMADTRIALTAAMQRRLAIPYRATGWPTSNWDIPTLAGAGGIRSTVDDMLRFLAAQITPRPNTPLGRGIETAWTVQWSPPQDGYQMGLGWHLAPHGWDLASARDVRWHNGMTGGYRAMVLVSRRTKTAVIVMANTATHGPDQLAVQVFRTMLGVPVKPSAFGFLGIDMQSSVTPAGALIDKVIANSPAAQGGLRGGDVIVRIAGEAVGNASAVSEAVRVRAPGQAVDVAVVRAGKPHTLRVTLGRQPQGPTFLGARLQPSSTPAGARVAYVLANGPAAQAGLQVGDVIVRFHGEAVVDIRAVVEAIRTQTPGTAVDVAVVRGGELHTLRVTLGTPPQGPGFRR